jgi:hypothetical protein
MQVQALLDEKRRVASYFCNQRLPLNPDDWVREIDGAKVLKEIFSALSETRVSYDKVKHAPALTEWIIDNAPAELSGIAAFLNQILS